MAVVTGLVNSRLLSAEPHQIRATVTFGSDFGAQRRPRPSPTFRFGLCTPIALGVGASQLLVKRAQRAKTRCCAGRVAVIGAGPAGLAAALALKKDGLDVKVYERSPELKFLDVGKGRQIFDRNHWGTTD